MPPEIALYRFVEQLDENDRFRVIRGIDARDGRAVVLKQLRRPGDVGRLERELALIQSLRVPGVVRALGIVDTPGAPSLALEDCGGRSLERHLAAGSIPLETKLELAVRLTAIVDAIHRAGVVHRNLRPSTILWNTHDDRLEVTDFSLATRATRDLASLALPVGFVGSAHYLAPEQTGRLDLVVDRRTDLYALGATLYHLFTGRPPFEGDDLAALLHAHIARVPERADKLVPDLPPILASILAKLLRKDPDDRYQTASGLEADLRRASAGVHDFELGADDAPTVLRVREALVGREAELGRLEALTRELAAGRRVIAYVHGEAGAGKSALLLEFARSVVVRGGICARGKFDLAIVASPYHPIGQILEALMGMLLALPGPALEALRARLDASMGALAPALVDVFPAIRPLFREITPLEAVSPVGARNRLIASFLAFLGAVAPTHVMTVLAVDDLQWADDASLTLLEAVVNDPSITGLGLILAARAHEVLPGSRLERFLASLEATGAHVERVSVTPLPREAVATILADSLRTTTARVDRLSHLVWAKTHGNPFFVRVLLESAIDRGFVRYEAGFVWDDAALEASPVAENVATLLAERLQDLPETTRETLTIAARVGDPIDLAIVAAMLGAGEAGLLETLGPAIERGMVLRAGTAIRFAHDKLVEAALALASPGRAQAIHAKLSAVLLARGDEARSFEAVDHLALAGEPANEAERARRSSLALAAARRAQRARAFGAAERYFEAYASTMDPGSFVDQFDATFDAHLEWAEAAFLAGSYERAEKLFGELEGRARSPVEHLRVRRILISYYEKTYRFVDAIRLSFATLAGVGVVLPDYEAISAEDVQAEMGRFLELLGRVDPKALVLCPSSTTREAISMLVNVAVPLWSVRVGALPFVVARAGILSLEEGLGPASGAGLVLVGSMLCLLLEDPTAGTAAAKLGLEVQERVRDPDYGGLVRFAYHVMVEFHSESARLGRDGLLAGYQRALAAGNRQWASYCKDQVPLRGALIGLPLSRVAEDVAESRSACLRLAQEDSLTFAEPLRHFVERILEREETLWDLGTRRADADAAMAHFRETKHGGPIAIHATLCMLEHLAGGDDQAAYAVARAEQERLLQPTGQLQTELGIALFALVSARCAPADDAAADAEIARAAARFARFARFEATSFGGYHALVDAARLDRTSSLDAAAAACDRAIDVFERDGVLHLLALANELAARVHRRAGHGRIARFYLEAALRAYERWGAPGAVRRLETELGLVAGRPLVAADASGEVSRVDVVSLLKATRAIAGEIELDRLIATLLPIVAENAGANRAYLFLDREGALELEARCDAELTVARALPGERSRVSEAPFAIATLVARTREPVVHQDASIVPQFASDPYLTRRGRVALLAAPIERVGKVAGVVVLENDLVSGAFTAHHAEVVSALNAQIAVALENAALYDVSRTRAASLAAANERLREEIVVRERAERALVDSEERLRQAQKMEALGLLAGGIVHDFNNFLTVIGVCSALVLDELTPDDRSRDLVEGIQRAGEAATSLTRQILEFSRRQVVTPKDVSLGAVVRQLAPMMRRLLPEHVRLGVTVDDRMNVVHADPSQIEQVLLNLVVNARDAMPRGGSIEIAVQGAERPGHVRLRVRDDGSGMDEATRARIFEPFFSTKGAGRGTGLGLSNVYGIVTSAGGTIQVDTKVGAGTTFEITLPVVEAGREVVRVATTEAVFQGAGQCILLVEDDPAVRNLAAGVLRARGYDVALAGDPLEAFAIAERLEQGPHPIDLVVTDLIMPNGTGRELAERLRGMRRSMRVLYMSGYTDDVIVHNLAREGSVSVLTKPFTPKALLEIVRDELARV